MSKNTCQQNSEIALKKAIQQDEWILLIGGTSEERNRLSDVAYKNKECVEGISAFSMYYHKLSRATELLSHDYDRIFRYTKFKWHKFELLDVAGCSSEEMSRKILGPESEKEYKSPNALLRNKPILNVLIQERLLFIDNFCCKHVNAVKKIAAQLRMYRSEYSGLKLGQLIVGLESKKDYETLPRKFVELFTPLSLEIGIDYEAKEQEEKVSQKKGKKIGNRKGKEKKLRGKKKHYIAPGKRNDIIKEMIEGHPGESNVFIARKAILEIEKDCGTKPDGKPLYAENTLTKEVSKLRTRKKRRKNAR